MVAEVPHSPVVPFNPGSKQDVDVLVDYIYSALNLDPDYVLPFAAIPESGRGFDGLDACSMPVKQEWTGAGLTRWQVAKQQRVDSPRDPFVFSLQRRTNFLPQVVHMAFPVYKLHRHYDRAQRSEIVQSQRKDDRYAVEIQPHCG